MKQVLLIHIIHSYGLRILKCAHPMRSCRTFKIMHCWSFAKPYDHMHHESGRLSMSIQLTLHDGTIFDTTSEGLVKHIHDRERPRDVLTGATDPSQLSMVKSEPVLHFTVYVQLSPTNCPCRTQPQSPVRPLLRRSAPTHPCDTNGNTARTSYLGAAAQVGSPLALAAQ